MQTEKISTLLPKTNDATTIDLKTKASGIYYLQLNTSQGNIHKKIMISN